MKKRWLMAVMMLFSVAVPLLQSGVAQAAPFARPANYGYFKNIKDGKGGNVFWDGIYTTNYVAFINYVEARLNGANNQNQTGAEFIILLMMGYPAGTSKATAHDPTVIDDWEKAVKYYNDNSWIDWHGSYSYTENTFWQGKYDDGPDPDDDAWFNDAGSTGADGAIIFHKPGGGFFVLQKICANPVGNIDALDQPPTADYNVALIADSNGSSLTVIPGQSYRIGVQVINKGAADSTPGDIQVMYPAAGVVLPCAPTCNDPGQNALLYGPTGPGGHSFRSASVIPGPVGRNWDWSVGVLPMAGVAGNTAGSVLNWKVSPGAVINSTITFDVYYYKANGSGALRHTPVVFRVVSARTPGVQGMNGDIHAGGGICGQALTDGSVIGRPGSKSLGQYVVSASAVAGISNFGSNNALSGAAGDKLRLGQTGEYAQTCRPDLVQAAENYWKAGVGGCVANVGNYCTIAGNDFDVTNKAGVYFYNGGSLTLHGTVTGKITVVARAGNVVISAPVVLSNAVYASHAAPSLGVIASGDIDINAAVTQVDAYLFANGAIDTCVEADISCVAGPLKINGFLMAKTIDFHRIGPLNASGVPVTELVTLNPQIYLNPPLLFDASVDDTLLEGQGEKQPLF